MLAEHRLDLARLNAKTPDLYLMVNPAEKFDVAVRKVTGQVSSLVQARARLVTERIRNEFLGGKVRSVQVSSSQPIPPMCNSPGTPIGTGWKCESEIYICVFAIGRPIGTLPLRSILLRRPG